MILMVQTELEKCFHVINGTNRQNFKRAFMLMILQADIEHDRY